MNGQSPTGTLIVLREITERKARERKLQQQNERLEQFASVISHDLRNPLNVAQGRINLAREAGDSEHLDTAMDGIERSLEMIEDLLALARGGQDIGDLNRVDMSELVEECWTTVQTQEATLVSDGSLTVWADRSRLRQLLENLFRNAVEHGGNAVTVRLGYLENGFFVADDGPGIPPEERESVFGFGYSKRETGTGFGLAIVKQVVDAHGWDIRITEGADGGSRFEITDIEVAEG
ncbi:MAG: sensor histidine kinase [Halodesulfurarchaeum sp.]